VDTGGGRTYGGGVTSPGDEHGRRPEDGGSTRPNEAYPTQQYGSQPYGTPPSGTSPYDAPGGRADQPPYVYNPYGNVSYPATYPSAPAGLGPDDGLPVRRPGTVHAALVLMILSTLPYLLLGLIAVLGAPSAAAALPPDDVAQLQELGIDLEQLVRATGIVLIVVAVIFVLLALLAWTGRRWARGLAAAMTAGFVLMVVASVGAAASQGTAVDAASLVLIVAPVTLAIIAVVLLFGARAREWFSASGR
jgi:hypothetical protein